MTVQNGGNPASLVFIFGWTGMNFADCIHHWPRTCFLWWETARLKARLGLASAPGGCEHASSLLGFSKKLLKIFLPYLQAMFHHYEFSNWLLLCDVNKSLLGKGNFRETKCEAGKYALLSEVLWLCLFYHILILPAVTRCIVHVPLWLLRQCGWNHS